MASIGVPANLMSMCVFKQTLRVLILSVSQYSAEWVMVVALSDV
jgi:hypothetical protein